MPYPAPRLSKAEVIDLYVNRGLSTRAAAKEGGVTEPTFLRYMKLYGVQGRVFHQKTPPLELAYKKRDSLVRAKRQEGYSFAQIAEMFRISRQRAHSICMYGHGGADA